MELKLVYAILYEVLQARINWATDELVSLTSEFYSKEDADEEEARDMTYDSFPDQRAVGILLGELNAYKDLQDKLQEYYEKYSGS